MRVYLSLLVAIWLLFFVDWISTTNSERVGINLVFDSDNTTNSTCDPCLPGSYSNESVLDCGDCPFGSCTNGTFCPLCPPGTFSDSYSSLNCTQCPAGTISNDSGASKCEECQSGEESNDQRTGCVPCSAGYMNPTPGMPCQPCELGTYTPSRGAVSCLPCPAGTYGASAGLSSCTVCGAGEFNPSNGSSSSSACQDCPAGKFCPVTDTGTPTECPAGYYCPIKSSQPSPCGKFHTSEAGASSCQFKTSFYLTIAGSVVGGILLIALVVGAGYLVVKRHRRLQEAHFKEKTKTDRLIPEPRGPIYGGY